MANVLLAGTPACWSQRVFPQDVDLDSKTLWLSASLPEDIAGIIGEVLDAGRPLYFATDTPGSQKYYKQDLVNYSSGVFLPVRFPQAAVDTLKAGNHIVVFVSCDFDDYRAALLNTATSFYLSVPQPSFSIMATATATSSMPSGLGAGSKRKRANEEMGRNVKTAPTHDDTFSAALLQGIDTVANDDNTRTAQAALAGTMDNGGYPDTGFDGGSGMNAAFGDNSHNVGDTSGQGYDTPGQTPAKAQVGTPQWHTQRKENHKEVERRRREVINEGIENIAKIVPGTEKNKGAILQRTAQYIQDLQDQISKFDTERQTFDVTIKELSKRIDLSREAMKQTLADANKWQQRCRDAGLSFDDYDGSGHDFDSLGTADLDAIDA